MEQPKNCEMLRYFMNVLFDHIFLYFEYFTSCLLENNTVLEWGGITLAYE